MPKPTVYAYLDYQQYLTDWFQYQKREVNGYSLATFAKAGGCARSSLANVMSGNRKPRPETLDAYALAMNLSPDERNFLGLLVDLSNANDLDRRWEVLSSILTAGQTRKVRTVEHEPDDDVARYLEHWYIPVIRELAVLPGFHADAEWVAKQVRPSVTIDEAQAALDTLFDLNLLVQTDEGVDVPDLRFRSKQETANTAVTRFHRTVLPELMGSIDTSRSHIQHLLTATLRLNESQIPEVKQRLDTVFEQIAVLADDRTATVDQRIYQLGIQVIPVS